jgi:hypothetical protein
MLLDCGRIDFDAVLVVNDVSEERIAIMKTSVHIFTAMKNSNFNVVVILFFLPSQVTVSILGFSH